MPPAPARRQPDAPAIAWFESERNLHLVHEVQRQVVPELTRVFGQTGLYLRPSAAIAAGLPGNMLASVLSLHRHGRGFAGDLCCDDAALPVASARLALVYALFVLETSPAPGQLLGEVARVLKPDGVALFIGLNPWGLMRLRWAFRGFASSAGSGRALQVSEAGLDVQRSRFVGPRWDVPAQRDPAPASEGGLLAPLRMAHLLVARKRDPGLTPLRAGTPVVGFRPGITPG